VRASLGLGTTPADLDRLTDALHDIARNGPATRYRYVSADDEYQPADPVRAGASRASPLATGVAPNATEHAPVGERNGKATEQPQILRPES
jgi:hypothetical protein